MINALLAVVDKILFTIINYWLVQNIEKIRYAFMRSRPNFAYMMSMSIANCVCTCSAEPNNMGPTKVFKLQVWLTFEI